MVKNPLASAGDTKGKSSIPGSGRFPGGENGNLVLPGKSHGQRSLAGYGPRGHKELDTTEHACTHARTVFMKLARPEAGLHVTVLKRGSRAVYKCRHLKKSCFLGFAYVSLQNYQL